VTPRDAALSVCSEDEDPRVVALVERAVCEDRARREAGTEEVPDEGAGEAEGIVAYDNFYGAWVPMVLRVYGRRGLATGYEVLLHAPWLGCVFPLNPKAPRDEWVYGEKIQEVKR
jgi:hypothetical protein